MAAAPRLLCPQDFSPKDTDWVVISSTRGSSWSRDQTRVSRVSCFGRWILYHWATWEAQWSISSVLPFSSVSQSCPTLCDPNNCSTPGLPAHHQLLEFTQTHVHWVSDAIHPSHPLLSPSPPAPSPSQHQGLFQWVNSLFGAYEHRHQITII